MSTEPSPSPLAPSGHPDPRPWQVLVVAPEAGDGSLQSLRQWAGDAGLEIEAAPDLPRAVRQLAARRWDVVLAILGERPDEELSWWAGALPGPAGSPPLLAPPQPPPLV